MKQYVCVFISHFLNVNRYSLELKGNICSFKYSYDIFLHMFLNHNRIHL
jgi:hypothetical protein